MTTSTFQLILCTHATQQARNMAQVASVRRDAQLTRVAVDTHRVKTHDAAESQRDELANALGHRAHEAKLAADRLRAATAESLVEERRRLAMIDAKKAQLAAERRAKKEADEAKTSEVLRQRAVQERMIKTYTVRTTREAAEQARYEVSSTMRQARQESAHDVKIESKWLRHHRERQANNDVEQRQKRVARVRDGRCVRWYWMRVAIFACSLPLSSSDAFFIFLCPSFLCARMYVYMYACGV